MKTLVIVYRSLFVGGIEKYVIDMMKNAITKGNRVIWMCHKDVKYSHIYDSIIEKVEIVPTDFSRFNILKVPQLEIASNEELYVFTFDVFRLYLGYNIRRQYPKNKVNVFYAIPHFTGSTIFPEQIIPFPIKFVVKRLFRYVYKTCFTNGSLMFFSKRHIEAIEEAYNINLSNAGKKMVPTISRRQSFDESRVRDVFRSDKFVIISPGRFDFPHKGYLLGLIKTFGILKPSIPNLYLKIVGDGPDKTVVTDAINALPKDVQSSIELIAPMDSDALVEEMSKCNLNVSVAGCCNLGARNGIVSTPARHYCTDCEVYGFFPESKMKTTSSEPGVPVEEYIRKVLHMSEDEYVECARNAYNSFTDSKCDSLFPFGELCNTQYKPSKVIRLGVLTSFLIQRFVVHLKIKTEHV